MNLLDSILENHGKPQIISENHDIGTINWVNGLSDPGEMISCGYLPEARRLAGEDDEAYAGRIQVIIDALPADQREKIMTQGRTAATRRASLDTSMGKVAVMVAGKPAWHRLGVNVERAVNSREAITLAGQNWRVKKIPAGWTYMDTPRQSTETFILIREDTGAELGSVGKVYQPIQNENAYEFLDGVLAEHGARYETAGSIYGGKKVWMLAHLPQQSFTVNGGDRQEAYALFTNVHDGSGRAFCFPTSERPVCANTLRIACRHQRGKGIGIRHTGDIKSKIREAQEALGIAVQGFDQYRQDAETMYSVKGVNITHYANDVLDACLEVTQADCLKGADALAAALAKDEAQREFLSKSFAKKIERRGEVLADILERYESQTCGIGSIRGTAWSAFNAVTEHADFNTIGKQSRDQLTREERRFESIIEGERDDMKQVAYAKALAL